MGITTNELLKEAEALKARRLFDKAKKLIKKIIIREPACVKAYILLGDIECENKNLDDAISFYSRAIKIDRKCFQGWINRANCYKEKG
ncbi:MAG: SHNi-TPR domain-containing protein, partial [Elusimicrobia bacterium]|nr:SHNi-TPR domain-containing protein [Elusimicrobiota bacterium]